MKLIASSQHPKSVPYRHLGYLSAAGDSARATGVLLIILSVVFAAAASGIVKFSKQPGTRGVSRWISGAAACLLLFGGVIAIQQGKDRKRRMNEKMWIIRLRSEIVIDSQKLPSAPGSYDLQSFASSQNPAMPLTDVYGNPFLAILEKNGNWVLQSNGEDGQPGTADDSRQNWLTAEHMRQVLDQPQDRTPDQQPEDSKTERWDDL